jgi:hypothetical protein
MLFDKGEGGQEGTEGEEKTDVKVEAGTEVDKPLDEQGGDADADGGAEGGEAGEDGGLEKGTAGEEGGGAEGGEPGEVDSAKVIGDLTARITELESHIKSLSAPATPQAPAKAPELTEEEWQKAEEATGIPRTGIKFFSQAQNRMANELKSFIQSELSEFRLDRSISQLAKDPQFTDAVKFDSDIREYLKRVDPQYHTNADVLKDAVIWSRGKNYKGTIKKVRDEKEINKRIAGTARPASPAGGPKGPSKPLTPVEKSAAAAVNMSEAEYAKLKTRGRFVAA